MKNKKIVEIKNNCLEKIPKRKQKNYLNEYLKNNVRGKDYFVDGEKIIVNKYTIGKINYGKTLFDSRIDKKIRKELKANIIINLEDIINNSNLYQKDRIDKKNHDFANTFDRRKSIIIYKEVKYKIMFDIGKKDGISTLYGIESIKK